MVNQVNRRGYRDWLVQRITALIIGAYALTVVISIATSPGLTYHAWLQLYATVWMRVFTVITLLSVLWHAWIGLWTVFTDYVKPVRLRLFLELIVILALLVYLIWCVDILW